MLEGLYLATLVGTLLVLAAAFSSLLAKRYGAPLLLVFLLIGLAAGVDGLGIDFENTGVAYLVGSLALAVILFDSGFGTPFSSFRHAAMPAITLATAGVMLTMLVFGVAARFLLGLSWLEAMLLGAIVSSTDAAAVFFLLRIGGLTIRDRVRATLEIESGSNDPMAIFLTITLVAILAAGKSDAAHAHALDLILAFVRQMGIGLIVGYGGGMLTVALVNRLEMERGLIPIFTLALALLVFAIAGALGGSGFLAVYVAGLYAGNRQIRGAPNLRRFQEGASWLAQIIMFLILGLLATPSQFWHLALPAGGLALFLILVARPLAIWLCLIPFNFQRNETAFIAWVGLRGAVSILLGILPMLGGLEEGRMLFNTAFIVVLVSLVVQGWTLSPLARRLGLAIPQRVGPIEKFELELPGSANHELLAYRVVAGSPVAQGERVPRWARPSLVIRDGRSMRYHHAGRLKEGDRVYLFISPGYPRLLDRLFASPAPVEGDDAEFFGAFVIDPSRSARDLELAYGLGLSQEEQELSIAEVMKARLAGHAEYADRVAIGPVELIVRDVDEDGEIATVGVSLEPELAPQVPLFLTRSEIAAKLRRWYRARRARRKRRDAGKPASVEQPPETAPAEAGPPEMAPPEAVHEPASTAAGEAVQAGAATPQSPGSSEPDAPADVVPAAGRTD